MTAALALAAEARGVLHETTGSMETVMARFGDDLDRASLRLTAGLVTLAACFLVAAVLMSRHE